MKLIIAAVLAFAAFVAAEDARQTILLPNAGFAKTKTDWTEGCAANAHNAKVAGYKSVKYTTVFEHVKAHSNYAQVDCIVEFQASGKAQAKDETSALIKQLDLRHAPGGAPGSTHSAPHSTHSAHHSTKTATPTHKATKTHSVKPSSTGKVGNDRRQAVIIPNGPKSYPGLAEEFDAACNQRANNIKGVARKDVKVFETIEHVPNKPKEAYVACVYQYTKAKKQVTQDNTNALIKDLHLKRA